MTARRVAGCPRAPQKPEARESAETPHAFDRPGGVSWQASLLNRFTRLAIKHPVGRAGLSPRTARMVARILELSSFGSGRSRSGAMQRRTIAGVPCDVIFPARPSPIERRVLYLHGGGFCVHLPKSYRRFAQRIAEAFSATVVLPEYRLAPEHRHPAATDDCLAVYRALLDDGCDPGQLCLMGDSAGGNLVLVTLLRARDQALPLPACAIVMSPGADLTFSGDSHRRNAAADPLVPIDALHQVARQYADPQALSHPHVSPMRGEFNGLPPLKILVGSTEVLLDDSVNIAALARAAGGDVVLQVWRQMPHVFPIYSFLPEAQFALRAMAGFFDRHRRPFAG